MMDLQHLKSFVAVVAAGSFTRAALQLGYSQSTITFHIKCLERELGALLLDRFRFSRAISLTEAGGQVYNSAARLLTLAEEIRFAVRRKSE